MELYLIWGETGDYYTPEDLYAVATSKEEAKRLKKECETRKRRIYNDSVELLVYEGAYIEEIKANERW